MNKKILTTFIIIFFAFVVFNLNAVFGVGIVSQAWTDDIDGDGKQDLIFREYTSPHDNTVKSYHKTTKTETVEGGIWSYKNPADDNMYISGWIDTSDSGTSIPTDPAYFRTIGYAFHTEPMGDYSIKEEKYIGYNLPKNALGQWIDSISSAYTDSSVVYCTPKIAKNYSDVVFYELMRVIPTYSNVSWGSGLTMTSYVHNKKTQLRYCIVNIGGTNVHVSDNVVYGDDLASLVAQSKAKGLENTFYVSNIIISDAFGDKNEWEVFRTAKNFYIDQHGRGSGWFRMGNWL